MEYLERFSTERDVAHYDDLYRRDGRERRVWSMQRQWLLRQLPRLVEGPERVLDFACGTGRILELLAEACPKAAVDGIDLSPAMLARAADRLKNHVSLQVGDITRDRTVCAGPYDLITAFRFFLNVDRVAGRAVLQALADRLDRGGVLLLNNHGNHLSLRTPLMRSRSRGATSMANTLRHGDLLRMAEEANLSLVGEWGMFPMPDLAYRLHPNLATRIDRAFGVRESHRGTVEVAYAFSRR